LTLYWAEGLSTQTKDTDLQKQFKVVAEALKSNENKIVNHLNEIQGVSLDIDGYYNPNDSLVTSAMRPDETFNTIIRNI